MFKTLAVVAALTAGMSSVAMAQSYAYRCPPGYGLYYGECRPIGPTPGGVVTGAVDTAGAIAGDAIGTAGAIAGGTINALTGNR